MAYHEFTLDSVRKAFGLHIERVDLFSSVEPRPLSELVRGTLKRGSYLALASRTEKATSEFIIAPILLEWLDHTAGQISLFSGVEFNVDRARGLNGHCDYLVTRGRKALVMAAPVIAVVESKCDEVGSGLGQCIAEMVAAQMHNKAEAAPTLVIYGVVTSGDDWQFLRLQEQTVTVDERIYYLVELDKILGILVHLATHL